MKPLTNEEFDELIQRLNEPFSKEQCASARAAHPLNPNPNTGTMYSATAGYIFRCAMCTEIGFAHQWYRIILDTIGGSSFFHRKTSEEDLRNGFDNTNLSKADDAADYYSSSINYIKGRGYVCDHCHDSIDLS